MKITGTGFYKQRNGGRCEVVAISRGEALGWQDCDDDDDRAPTMWRISDGYWSTTEDEEHESMTFEHDIVGPWPEPQETWTPTGRVMFRKSDGEGWHLYTARNSEMKSRTLHYEERSDSGETRWVPVPVEE